MKSTIMVVFLLIGLLSFSVSIVQYYENVNRIHQVLTVEYDGNGFNIVGVKDSLNPIVYFFGALCGIVIATAAAIKFMRDNGKGIGFKPDGTSLSNNAVSVINTTIAVSVVLGMYITAFLHTRDVMLLVFIAAFIIVIVFNLEKLGACIKNASGVALDRV